MNGDFSIRLDFSRDQVMTEIAEAYNDVANLNGRVTDEFIRISEVVGREGNMTERASVANLTGGWQIQIESLNSLIVNLAQPTMEAGRVITAVARGDLSRQMALEIEGVPVKGEFQRIGIIVNTMVDQLNGFASEVTRVAREVGTEGILGGQADVKGVSGVWKDLTDSVNAMAGSLTSQVRNIAEVTTAVAEGDLSRKITVEAKGEILQLMNTINRMVDQLNAFGAEVTRVSREVGTEGVLGGQADVKGVSGVWKDLTDSVNGMANNLTSQVRNIALVTTAVATGDLSQKITVEAMGEILELKNTINQMVDRLNAFAAQVTRVAREVGTDGKLGGQAVVEDVSGVWKDLTDSVNGMANNLTTQVRNIALVTTAVANGDLSQKITVEAMGEILELKDTINQMVDRLNAFAAQVTRVAREVGTDGKLGGQAEVEGVSGVWKDLTESVNGMAGSLTNQVRNIAEVTTAVADGDLSRKITVEARGEILQLKETINQMVDRLNAFSAEVTRVAREVGTEGILGGQGEVKGVSGVWKDLTENVNRMANNLTNQVRNIAEVTTAVAQGDLSRKITVEAKGEILQLKETMNQMMDQLNAFSAEVTRVAREVGTDGVLGGQAMVKDVSGVWKDLTDNVNAMAGSLTNQVRNIAEVTTAVAQGDLSRKITVEAKGEILQLKETMNQMMDQLNAFAAEVTRVAREVGTDGKLGGQAVVKDVSGVWKDLTENVNRMAANLTDQVRNIALVTTSVANGDLSRKITVEASGEIFKLKDTINQMVDQLNAFAAEVTRVAREVGTDGKLGGQAEVKGVSGVWKDLTENVNAMAGSLTNQVRNIAEVTTAVAEGDLSRKITVTASGEILQLKETINRMVDQLNAFSSEVTRVAREVGTDGKLGGQAEVKGVSGVWKDLTENVNAMAGSLTGQVRNIAEVTTAVAGGDLSRKITVTARGEILQLKETINQMVDQLNAFASEVTRVAKEVGAEGKLGGQAEVTGVSGTWKNLTDSVNAMAGSLTSQVRDITKVTTAVANGDLSQKITVEARGEILELKDTINRMADQLNAFATEVTRVAREVGTEGKLGGQAYVRGVSGVWKDLTENVNRMASNLTDQVRNIALVTTAVATGDLSQKITVEAQGEILQLKNTINKMVDQLNAFSSEVTRVAREVGTDGKLGGQAYILGTLGVWKDLTDNVNRMGNNLTDQVRNIAVVTTAVANGDLSRKITVEARGEILELKDTINQMVDQLNAFAAEVTRVAREVGTDGKLGGQVLVKGVSGVWKDLTDNTNAMAANLTTQVRAIAEVATAVTKGDLTRSVAVEARGEVAELKDNVNQMISTLKDTTQRNEEQDWLKTNLARFTRMLQGQRNLETVAQMIMSDLTPLVSAHHGVFYVSEIVGEETYLKLLSSYAYVQRKNVSNRWRIAEGLVGQAAFEKKPIILNNVPMDYIKITSGLGEGTPLNIAVLPVLFENNVMAVVELASFSRFSDIYVTFLEQLMESMGVVINMILGSMRTEDLLKQSQSLTEELQNQQNELKRSNEELGGQTSALKESQSILEQQQSELQLANQELELKAGQLEDQRKNVEIKNRELELTQASLAERAEQLAITSKYKSEFLANMSHELRTPLNSMLLLSKLVSDNKDGNLTDKQLQYIKTVHGSGNDLLNLINEILDLSKIEAGKMDFNFGEIALGEVKAGMERSFIQLAEQKGLNFSVNIVEGTPGIIRTDGQRLKQILRNLLSNAFKFTEKGGVTLNIKRARYDRRFENDVLKTARTILAFSVADTGVGIPMGNQRVIWEAFQQADGTTSRKYGGTGLGLTISREIARMLGGEIHLESEEGRGSTFTLYLPQINRAPKDGGGEIRDIEGEPFDDSGDDSGHDFAPMAAYDSLICREKPTPKEMENTALYAEENTQDDRYTISPGDRTLLIMEDDPKFASVLMDMARDRSFKVLWADKGDTGLAMANEFKPDGIILDILLPVMDGWTILERLKSISNLRHIPVHIVSAVDEKQKGLQLGAVSYLTKPVSAEELERSFDQLDGFLRLGIRNLLVVEDNEAEREEIIRTIGNCDVTITAVGTGGEALDLLSRQRFDCMILDMKLPDISGFVVLHQMTEEMNIRDMPVIVYTAVDLTSEETHTLQQYAHTIILKGEQSQARLLDETALFLHRMESRLPKEKQIILNQLHEQETVFRDKHILIVDDDMRNIFALTSVLESHELKVSYAENGKDSIVMLKSTPDIDLVLMDIMMPEMDGYETIRQIRKDEKYQALPIIALTAKAMKGDREKCIVAGASDYISKPVNSEQLLSLMRVWLYKH